MKPIPPLLAAALACTSFAGAAWAATGGAADGGAAHRLPADGVRDGHLRRLLRRVERHPGAAYPLMSVTNAISSVIVVGALLAVGIQAITWGGVLAKIFGFLALIMASVNIFRGFLVTSRMLAMYRRKDVKKVSARAHLLAS